VLTVAFDPSSAGPREVALTIHSDDPDNPAYTFTLMAEGLAAQIEPAAAMRVQKNQTAINPDDTHDLGEAQAGQTINDALAIFNDGDAPLVISSATEQGDGGFEFDVPLNQPIAPGDLAVMTVHFTAVMTGEYANTVTMITNDPQRPQYAITFTAAVVEENVDLAPRIQVAADGEVIGEGETYDLGAVGAGFTKLQSFEVGNAGNATLHLGGAADPVQVFELTGGDVEEVTALLSASEIAPGQTATLVLAVNSPDGATREFEVVIASDDPQAPEYSFFVTANETVDCNENGIEDGLDIAGGTSEDCNGNSTPDECEVDSDGDGVIDDCDRCDGADDRADSDFDGAADCLDNCPGLFNPNQSDVDGDGIGDGCDNAINPGREAPNLPCGAGGAAMLPLMVMGLCGMRGLRYACTVDDQG